MVQEVGVAVQGDGVKGGLVTGAQVVVRGGRVMQLRHHGDRTDRRRSAS